MSDGHRALLATLAAIAGAPVVAWLTSEVVMVYEMYATGANSRTELGDDFGLGFLLFFFVPIGTLLGAIGLWLIVWYRTKPLES